VVALGAFDGVHRGHQSALEQVRRLARERNAEATVLTFDPGPREFVAGIRQPGTRLTTRAEQMCRLRQLGLELALVIQFPGLVSDLSPEHFVRDVLVGQLRATCVCAGESHRFGRDGDGDLKLLQRLGRRYGFGVVVIDPVVVGGSRISSTVIRALLSRSEVAHAATLLGRPYALVADVVSGQGMGASLGFPTANLRTPPEKLLPADGVYAGVAGRAVGPCALMSDAYPAAINVGTAPTLERNNRVVEAHLIGAEGDFVGATLRVQFVGWLRAEESFADRDALIAQIRRDVAQCIEQISADLCAWTPA
jgi:riboflavin kinase/FMN adenylyltransferase